MSGSYVRITARKLATALADPGWALRYADDVVDAESEIAVAPARARHLDTSWAWDALAFLLRRAGLPVDFVHGGHEIAGAETGYGPLRYLDPDQVGLVARTLADLPFAVLADGLAPADLAGCHPQNKWDEPDALVEVQSFYEPLRAYFRAAAREREAVLVWLD